MARLLPAMTQQKLDTQRDVVKNERRWSMDNQPYGTWWERLPALCFPESSTRSTTRSSARWRTSTRRAWTTSREFFATYYTPDNAVLSIAGDFEPAEARRADRASTSARSRAAAARPPLPDMTLPPTFGGARRATVQRRRRCCRASSSRSASPPFGSDGYYAASVCAAVLGPAPGQPALIARLVRERQVASEAHAFTYDLAKGSDLLVVDAVARPEIDVATLEAELVAEIDRLIADGVTDDEVARALALIESGVVLALQSAGDRADQLSRFATYFGDPSLVNTQVERYRAVTPAAVGAFARERLGRDNRAFLIYVPKESDERSALSDEEGSVAEPAVSVEGGR